MRTFFANDMLILNILCMFFITCNIPTKPETVEPPEILWTKTFGGTEWDAGYSVQQTSDGGYIIAGETSSFGLGSVDIWLIKTDDNGVEEWNKTFEGSMDDWSTSVQQTSDGGYIVMGITESYGAGGWDVWLIKTDELGDSLWTRTYGGPNEDSGTSVWQTSDEGYIITGTTWSYGEGESDIWLIKTDTLGDTLWTKTYGGSRGDESSSVQQTFDGGYIVIGATKSYTTGEWDVWLIKTDSNGVEEWNKIFGGSSNDWSTSGQQSSDGGYIIMGGTISYGAGERDVWLIKTDANGVEEWNKTFGGSIDDYGISIQQTSDKGYIITGKIKDYRNGDEVWLIRTDALGDTLWTQTFGGSNIDSGTSVKQTYDDGFIITGYTLSYGAGESDVWLIKLAPE